MSNEETVRHLRLVFGVSAETARKLATIGSRIEDFNPLDVPRLFEMGLNWSTIKKIVSKVKETGLDVVFAVPGHEWEEDGRWYELLKEMVENGLVSWKDVAIATLGEMNPPQVGTSTASNANFKKLYNVGGQRGTMRKVMEWLYKQPGTCAGCKTHLFLEADHIRGKEHFVAERRDPAEADTLENLQLLCKRCNVIKRKSHKLGGLSFLTAQAALMWILLVLQPKAKGEFTVLCRRYGLTMADVRFDEAWAMALWLRNANKYPA
jgi:hypothetical protein